MRAVLQSKPLLAAVFAYSAAIASSYLVPHQVTAFVQIQHLTDGEVGIVAMTEVASLALTMIFAAMLPGGVARVAGVVAPCLAAVAQLACIGTSGIASLCVLRAIVGAGCGLASCSVVRTIAQSGLSGPAYGAANAMSAISTGALLCGVPLIPSPNAGIRVFVPLAALAAALSVATYAATRGQIHVSAAPSTGNASGTRSARATAIALLLVTELVFIPLGGIWTFSVQQGTNLGLSEGEAGMVLGWATFGGLAGGAIAGWLHDRIGLAAALALGCGLSVASCIAVGTVASEVAFALAFLFYVITYTFVLSYILTAGASADARGRLSAMLLGAQLIGYAIGSYLVGSLLEHGNPALVWIGGGLTCALALVPAVWAAQRIESVRIPAAGI